METHNGASASTNVADGVVVGAAAATVFAAGGALEGAAPPGEAVTVELEDAATGVAGRACIVGATDGWRGRRRAWMRRSRGRLGRVAAFLDRVGGLYGNAAQTRFRLHIPLHPEVPFLTPGRAPRVPHYPEIQPVFATVSNHGHTVVEVQSTLPCEYTLSRIQYLQVKKPCFYVGI